MNWLNRQMIDTHPLVKLVAYLDLCILGVWGPLVAVVIVAFVSFALLLLWPVRHGVITNPWYSLVLCGLAVVIVIPGASQAELAYVVRLSLRMLCVILVSSSLGLVFRVNDVLVLGRVSRWPKRLSGLVVAFVRFVPVAMRSIEAVVLSQRSRGFVFRWWGLLSPAVYRVIVVPFLVGILHDALGMWVSLNMRQWALYEPTCRKLGLGDLAFLLLTFSMWALPR